MVQRPAFSLSNEPIISLLENNPCPTLSFWATAAVKDHRRIPNHRQTVLDPKAPTCLVLNITRTR